MSVSRSTQSRINGAKSRGPKTAAGKARSALNALKHGRYGTNAIVLSNEDPAAFEDLVAAFVAVVRPLNTVEYNLARQLAGIDWRLTRVTAVESRIIDHELDLQVPSLEATGVTVADLTRLALAVQGVIDRSRLPDFLARRQTQLIRDRQTTLRTLHQLRQRRNQAAPADEIIPPTPLDPEASIPPNTPPPAPPVTPTPWEALIDTGWMTPGGVSSQPPNIARQASNQEARDEVSPLGSLPSGALPVARNQPGTNPTCRPKTPAPAPRLQARVQPMSCATTPARRTLPLRRALTPGNLGALTSQYRRCGQPHNQLRLRGRRQPELRHRRRRHATEKDQLFRLRRAPPANHDHAPNRAACHCAHQHRLCLRRPRQSGFGNRSGPQSGAVQLRPG